MTTLTTTQHSALGDLRRFGRLFGSEGVKVERGTVFGYSTRTLQALVDAGLARWEGTWGPGQQQTAPSVVPTTPAWEIWFDPEQRRPRDPHTKCPHCGGLDEIVEVDQAVRFNRLKLSSNGATATASTGDGDWEFNAWRCQACGSEDLIAPEGFEILDWY